MKRCGLRRWRAKLCRVSDFHEAHDALLLYMVAGLTAIPARCSRDLAMRKTIQAELNSCRSNVADEFKRRAAELGERRSGMKRMIECTFLAAGFLICDQMTPEMAERWHAELHRVIEQRGGLVGEHIDMAIGRDVMAEVAERAMRLFADELNALMDTAAWYRRRRCRC